MDARVVASFMISNLFTTAQAHVVQELPARHGQQHSQSAGAVAVASSSVEPKGCASFGHPQKP